MISQIETKKIKILLIEDNPREAQLIQSIINQDRENRFDLEWSNKLSMGQKRLAQGDIELVLLDLSLPDSKWFETYNTLRMKAPHIPIVILTSINNESHSMEVMRSGAQDYLIKGEIEIGSFLRTIHYAMERNKMQEELRGLYTQVEKDLQETEELIQFSYKINNVKDLNELLNIVKMDLPNIFHADLFSIFLINPKTQFLELTIHNHPVSREFELPLAVPENGGLMWDTIRLKKPIRISNFSESLYSKPWKSSRYENETAICIPLIVKSMVLGVINLNNLSPSGIHQENMNNIQRVCNHLATAIYNTILNKQIEELSVTDELTGLYNRRYLFEHLPKEIERSKRYQDAFTILMIDLDNFKETNDTLGHSIGDIVLKEASKCIKSALRLTDIVCRYGGDEFIAILPETSCKDAAKFAERLQQKLASYSIQIDLQKNIVVTPSIGMTEFKELDDVNSLIARADSALYQAKEKGRNCIVATD